MARDPAEHRGDSLTERVRALEDFAERVEFDSLPLRKLKDFLEDNMILDAKNSLMPGTFIGDTFNFDDLLTNQNFIDLINSIAGGGGGFGDHAMSWPNFLGENAIETPTWATAWGGNPANIQNYNHQAWENYHFTRWICPRDMTVSKASTFANAPPGANANSNIWLGLYSETMATRHAQFTPKHVNSDLGLGGTNELITVDLTASFDLVAGTTYCTVMGLDANGSNFPSFHTIPFNHSFVNDFITILNGGNPATDADQQRWYVHGNFVPSADQNGNPSDWTAVALASAGSADAPYWWFHA